MNDFDSIRAALSPYFEELLQLGPYHPGSYSLCTRVAACAAGVVRIRPESVKTCLEFFDSSGFEMLQREFAAAVAAGRASQDERFQLLNIVFTYLHSHPGSLAARLLARSHLSFPDSTLNLPDWVLSKPDELFFFNVLNFLEPIEGGLFKQLVNTLAMYRTGLREKSLPIWRLISIRGFDDWKLANFCRLLQFEHQNEDMETTRALVMKALQQLTQVEVEIEALEWVRNTFELSIAHLQAINTLFQSWTLLPLCDFSVPEDLQPLLKLNLKPGMRHYVCQFLQWLEQIISKSLHSRIFPIRVEEFVNMSVLNLDSESEAESVLFNSILQVAFPEVLLCIQLSSLNDKSTWQDLWQQEHGLTLNIWVSKRLVMRRGERKTLLAVFTKDSCELQSSMLPKDALWERSTLITQPSLLSDHLRLFLSDPIQKIYCLDVIDSEHLQTAKSLFESQRIEFEKKGKIVCLLIRLPATPVTGCWGSEWDIITLETLQQPFQDSLPALSQWLRTDYRAVLLSDDFLKSNERIRTVLERIYEQLPLSETRKRTSISQIAGCQLLVKRLNAKLRKIVEYRFMDWKLPVLSDVHLAHFPLKSALDCFFLSEAANILRPAIATVEYYSAFYSFFQAAPDSLVQTFWLETFDSLPEQVLEKEPPDLELRYPFSRKDYEMLFQDAQVTIGAAQNYLLQVFEKVSVTLKHSLSGRSQTVARKELLALFVSDMAKMDLWRLPFAREGVFFMEVLCAGQSSFADAVKEFSTYRSRVMSLCEEMNSPGMRDIQRRALESVMMMLDTPNGGMLPTRTDLLAALDEFEEEAANSESRPHRLYALSGSSLYTFNCIRRQSSILELGEGLGVLHPSIVWVDIDWLFCCGGTEMSIFHNNKSSKAWRISPTHGVVSLTCMKNRRAAHGLVRFHDFVYVIGGNNEVIPLRSLEKYSLKEEKWESLTTFLAEDRYSFSPCIWKEKVYLCGGGKAQDVEVLDPYCDSLTSCGLQLTLLPSCIAVVVGDELVVIGVEMRCVLNLTSLRWEMFRNKVLTQVPVSASEPVFRMGEIYWMQYNAKAVWVDLAVQVVSTEK